MEPWSTGGRPPPEPEPWTGPPADWDPDPAAGPSPRWEELPPRGVRGWDGLPVEAGPDHARYDRVAIAGLVFSILGGVVGAVLCVVALVRIGGGPGRRRGRWMAVLGLAISLVWAVVLTVVAATVVGRALEHTNADDYVGEEREVAVVIDRAEEALEAGDAATFCGELRTRELQVLDPACARRVADVGNDRAGEVRIESLVIDGDRAEVLTSGGGDDLLWSLVRVDGVWLIDDVV